MRKLIIGKASDGKSYIRITNGLDYLEVHADLKKFTLDDLVKLKKEFVELVNKRRLEASLV